MSRVRHNLSFFLLISTQSAQRFALALRNRHRNRGSSSIAGALWSSNVEFHWKRIGEQNMNNYRCSRALRIIERDQRRPTFMNNCHERSLSFVDLFPVRDAPRFKENPCWEMSKPLRRSYQEDWSKESRESQEFYENLPISILNILNAASNTTQQNL